MPATISPDLSPISPDLARQMPMLGVEPSIVNYNTAVRALSRGGELARVKQVMTLFRPPATSHDLP